MATPPIINPGTRFAFAPYENPIEGLLYRIYIVFENAHGDLFGAGTDLMAPSLEAADTMCDTLNVHVDLNRDQWKCLASAVFSSMEYTQERAATQIQKTEGGGDFTPCDPDEDW